MESRDLKKYLALFTVLIFALSFVSCGAAGSSGNASGEGGAGESSQAETDGQETQHKIAVLVYNRADDEVMSFKKYLEDYIGSIFNVQFFYSDTIRSGEEALAFIESAAEYGAEGVMSFNSYDLKAEVELAAENKMYFMMASGTVSDQAFASVEDNEYFVGVVGPGSFIEYKAGSDMAKHFIAEHETNEYFILSGGGCLGNEMHKLRTEGIIDTLQNAYSVRFDMTSEEIAVSEEPLFFEEGDLKICVVPGYISYDEYFEVVEEQYKEHPFSTVLAAMAAPRMMEAHKNAVYGVIDCYSENNMRYFTNGQLDYVCGKYSSIIGPSFAAMYNAVTGHASEFRVNGKAFHITQGFWASESKEDFNEKYVLASSIERNAYNYADLQKVICIYNSEAAFEDLKKLAEEYTFADAIARRM